MAGQNLLDGLLGLAGEYVRQNVSISVKTNFGPEIPIASASLDGGASSAGASRGFGLGDLIGFKAAVIVRDGAGAVVHSFGSPPATSPVRAAVAVLIVAGLAYLLVRGALK